MTLHIFNPEHDIALASGLANFTAPHAGRQLRHDLGFLPALWASEGDIIMVDDVDQARRSLERLTHRLHTLQQTQSLLRANSEFTPGKLRVYSGQTPGLPGAQFRGLFVRLSGGARPFRFCPHF